MGGKEAAAASWTAGALSSFVPAGLPIIEDPDRESRRETAGEKRILRSRPQHLSSKHTTGLSAFIPKPHLRL